MKQLDIILSKSLPIVWRLLINLSLRPPRKRHEKS